MSCGLSPASDAQEDEQRALMRALAAAMPPLHREFLSRLRLSFTCGDFFFAHASVRPGVPLAEQREADLLWIREEFLQSKKNFGKYIVHGHTPCAAPRYCPIAPISIPAPTRPEPEAAVDPGI
jgi:serine/threonine protein phosphatase 1